MEWYKMSRWNILAEKTLNNDSENIMYRCER